MKWETTGATPQVAILFSLPDEAKPFLKSASANRAKVAICGVGAARAEATTRELLTDGFPTNGILIVCGFAGGLSSYLGAGDLILAERVLDPTAPHKTYIADSSLRARGESLRVSGVAYRTGVLATGSRVLITKQEKGAFFEETQADAVDMETVGAIRVAEERGVRWLAVRALSDDAETDLPLDFNTLTGANGFPALGRIVLQTLLHPTKIPALIGLGKRSALAAHNLSRFLEAFLKEQSQ